jgi:hypothetical protein
MWASVSSLFSISASSGIGSVVARFLETGVKPCFASCARQSAPPAWIFGFSCLRIETRSSMAFSFTIASAPLSNLRIKDLLKTRNENYYPPDKAIKDKRLRNWSFMSGWWLSRSSLTASATKVESKRSISKLVSHWWAQERFSTVPVSTNDSHWILFVRNVALGVYFSFLNATEAWTCWWSAMIRPFPRWGRLEDVMNINRDKFL